MNVKQLYQGAKKRVSSIIDNNTGMVVGTVGTGLAVMGGSAHAAIDTTAILASISDAQTAAVGVASAVLVMIVAVKAFRYIRRAL